MLSILFRFRQNKIKLEDNWKKLNTNLLQWKRIKMSYIKNCKLQNTQWTHTIVPWQILRQKLKSCKRKRSVIQLWFLPLRSNRNNVKRIVSVNVSEFWIILDLSNRDTVLTCLTVTFHLVGSRRNATRQQVPRDEPVRSRNKETEGRCFSSWSGKQWSQREDDGQRTWNWKFTGNKWNHTDNFFQTVQQQFIFFVITDNFDSFRHNWRDKQMNT